jgi:mRNA interferase HigB
MQYVELVNVTAIERFVARHPDAAKWLGNWIDVAAASSWQSIHDVRRQFPSADGVKLKSRVVVTVFNVKGNQYRLLTIINYAVQRIVIFDLLTHAEYDRQKWK